VVGLISNILVPDPELRYGLRQVTTNTWFRKTYVANEEIQDGIEVGIDNVRVYQTVLNEMTKCEDLKIDKIQVKMQIQANQNTPLTAFYYLLLKKKMIEGEPIEDEGEKIDPSAALLIPKDRQTKKY
jgi:hypothetical protein